MALEYPRACITYGIVGSDTILSVFSAVKCLEEERASSPRISRGRMLCVVDNEAQGEVQPCISFSGLRIARTTSD